MPERHKSRPPGSFACHIHPFFHSKELLKYSYKFYIPLQFYKLVFRKRLGTGSFHAIERAVFEQIFFENKATYRQILSNIPAEIRIEPLGLNMTGLFFIQYLQYFML